MDDQRQEVCLENFKNHQECYSLCDLKKCGRLRRLRYENRVFGFISRYLKEGATILEKIGVGRGELTEIVQWPSLCCARIY